MVPLPSRPALLSPQHFTPPVLVRAQVCLAPAAIDITPLKSPFTGTGLFHEVVLPMPSWP
jgi:hypothetical protein